MLHLLIPAVLSMELHNQILDSKKAQTLIKSLSTVKEHCTSMFRACIRIIKIKTVHITQK